jgi:hypothetical protein
VGGVSIKGFCMMEISSYQSPSTTSSIEQDAPNLGLLVNSETDFHIFVRGGG